MKHVLEVLNAYIEQKINQLETQEERINEQWQEIRKLEEENEMLRNDLAELSKEHCKK
jgi:SMC interacting uncharacterized protein involved in chromosome segregation